MQRYEEERNAPEAADIRNAAKRKPVAAYANAYAAEAKHSPERDHLRSAKRAAVKS
jgi:hypothetical protein